MTSLARAAALCLLAVSPRALAQPAQSPVLVVFFDEWSGQLDHAARDVINQAALQAKQIAGARIEVAGYADNAGNAEANLALTQLRAHRVAEALERDGVPKSEITIKAEGAQQVQGVASRRVEITISK